MVIDKKYKKYKKFKNIFIIPLGLKKYDFDKIFIYYPSTSIFIVCTLSGIKDVYHYH